MSFPRTSFVSRLSFSLGLIFVSLSFFSLHLRAAGPNGLYATFLNSDGSVGFTPAVAAKFTAAEAGWIRAEAILPSGHTAWDTYSLGQLDQAVDNAVGAGLQIIMLLNKQSISGPVSTAPWNANNHESAGGNGQNSFQTDWVNDVVLPLVQHFHDRIKIYEIWNEPADTTSAIYFDPSTYSWLLTDSWIAVHETLGYTDVTVISGDGNSGTWLTAVYQQGVSSAVNSFASAKATYGVYPVDGFAQHMYIDGWEEAPSADISAWIGNYHSAYAAYEGSGTTKGTYITEFGWDAKYLASRGVSNPTQVQADDLGRSYTVCNVGGAGAYVKCGIWFNYQDNSVGDFGLLDSSGNQKLDYAPFQRHNTYEGKNSDGSTNSNILNYYTANGGQPVFGNPYDNGGSAFVHQVNRANAQDFNGGSHERLLIFDGSSGTFQMNNLNGLCSFYQTNGGSGRFGAPKNEEYTTSTGTRQDFTMSSLIFNSATGIGAQYEAEDLAVAAHTSADTVRVMIDSSMSDGQGSILDGQAVNDYVTYTVHVPAPGLYTIVVGVKKYPDRGTFQLAIASSVGGTYTNHGGAQDCYASSAQYVPLVVDPNSNFGSAGEKAFRFTVTGKNAASTGYSLSFDYIQVLPN